jgi:hypothetical protein
MKRVSRLSLMIHFAILLIDVILLMSGCNQPSTTDGKSKSDSLEISEPTVDKEGGGVGAGKTARLWVEVKNPKGLELKFEWKAEKGVIAPIRLSPTVAEYKAPNTPGEDLAILEIKSNGKQVFVSKPVKVFVTLTPRLPILPPMPLQGVVTITSPSDGSTHNGQEIWVEGRYDNLLGHLSIWVLTYPHNVRKYYLQSDQSGSPSQNVRGTTGNWSQRVKLGPDGKIEQRQLFDIVVVLANRDSNRLFSLKVQEWDKQMDSPGLKEGELPDGIVEKDRVTVIREQ